METKEQRWRKEGRREAALLLMQKTSAESIDNEELVSWSANGDAGDYSGYWNEKAVFTFFDAEISESYLDCQIQSAMMLQSASMDAKLIELMLKQVIEDYRHDLSTHGTTQLDRAAYYFGLHPDQKLKQAEEKNYE
ncbi:hypothetical protein C9I98_21460 [Photobacterium sanctipauli]|uniref:Uncharacterized protein n=1 Tax=Photobacterium sanctipauli TaxID=1342794 RepID=A0A2T3NI98_9GAMM|nr:hypothetical protein [Photobacterium sanctipauli]PSW14756.1 hypothetical protein C9I98_21460 [Photobacterium sanctipauli]